MRQSFVHSQGARFLSLCVLGMIVVVLAAARAQAPNRGSVTRPLAPRAKAIETVRVINTAEYNFRKNHNRFGTWNELYGSGAVTDLERTWPDMKELSITAGPEVIPDFRLALLVADDGASYSLSLHQTEGHGCGISVFSDQSGLIYEGTVIDCPKIADHPGSVMEHH